MAILVGVMAPQLIKYIEKTNVSSDTQLCDSVKTAVTTAMMDPSVINATNSGLPSANTDYTDVPTAGSAFASAFFEIMGKDNIGQVNAGLKSWNSGTAQVTFRVVGSNSVHVWIAGSDKDGKKGAGSGYANDAAHWIYVD
jgi:hypothetical protein